MSLESSLRNQIETTGPLTVFEFMRHALYDPHEGYYARKIPIGRQGDYITAPEMTQVFGEVIALWLADLWQQAGCPTPFHLIEIGPGRGTLMADILRTFDCLKIPLSKVHLVEVSPLFKELQQGTLSSFPTTFFWHQDLSTLPQDQGFCMMIANEFWDALPIQQFVKISAHWVERKIASNGKHLIFFPENLSPIREVCPAMPLLVAQIAGHLKRTSGAALFFDYGYDQMDAVGDTLQALYHHKPQSPLIHVGQADLTHHVDFYRLKTLFVENELSVHGPIPQGDFLKSIGFEIRTEHLIERAQSHQKGNLQTAYMRLTHPSHMGTLFKALAVTSPPSLHPCGF